MTRVDMAPVARVMAMGSRMQLNNVADGKSNELAVVKEGEQ